MSGCGRRALAVEAQPSRGRRELVGARASTSGRVEGAADVGEPRGPRHCGGATPSSSTAGVGAQGGERRGRARPPRGPRASSTASCAAPRTVDVPPAGVGRDRLEVPVAREHRRGRLRAPAGQPREAVGACRRPARASRGSTPARTPNFSRTAVLVEQRSLRAGRAAPPAVPRRTGRGPCRACRSRPARRAGRAAARAAAVASASSASSSTIAHTVDAERRERLLEQRELRSSAGLDALAGLVARPEVVAERLDHRVGRDADVGRAVARAARAASGAPPASPPPARRRARPRPAARGGAEELVRSIDEVDLHPGTVSGYGSAMSDAVITDRPVTVARDGPVATLVLSRPERRNPLSHETMTELTARLREAGDDPSVRPPVVLGAAGHRLQRRPRPARARDPQTRPSTSASSRPAPS